MLTSVQNYLRPFGNIPFGTICNLPAPAFSVRAAGRIPRGACSALVFALPYGTPEAFGGTVSAYAAVPDYHCVADAILGPLCEELAAVHGGSYAHFVDNSPFDEIALATACGLGVRGDNGLLITPQFGSYVFLAEIVTDAALPAMGEPIEPAGCLHCGACAKTCPGGAIDGGDVCTENCLSDITQRKRELSARDSALVAAHNLLWGCDRCQLVCPMNRGREAYALPVFAQDVLASPKTDDIAALCKTRAFGFRGPQPLLRNADLQKGEKKERN